jgi:dTDP-glucose 4,6-dehydratase
VCLDSLLTGSERNIAHLINSPRFSFEECNVTDYLHVEGPVDWILHFASPASPVDYQEHPIPTLKVGAMGTWRALGLAKAKNAGFFLASTSEVYGNPQVHPQPEEYWGHVNPIGPRSMYDEAKRYGEAISMAYYRTHGIPVKIVRIFNTYGPRMRKKDGRAVPNFIIQSLLGEPITVHGDGSQTRSLCYVDDLIEGIYRFLRSDLLGPCNIGNPEEVTILDLAQRIGSRAGSDSEVIFLERPIDDPELRCPDITRARNELGWQPTVALDQGLERTIQWARSSWI